VQRLAVTLDRLRRLLDAIVVAASTISTGGAVVAFSQGPPSVAVLVGLAGPVLGGLLRWVLRRYLRWKLVSILQDRTDSIVVPAT
jgi:uncharacterized membrane protein YeiH